MPAFRLFLSDSLPDDEGYVAGWLVDTGRCYPVQLRERGGTSRSFPKHSYTVDFPAQTIATDEEDPRHKLALIGRFNDPSHLRQRVAWTLWNWMSPGHVQVNAYNAVVYLDDEYLGLYTVVDHVDDELLAIQGFPEGEELFKSTTADADFSRQDRLGVEKVPVHRGFERKGVKDVESTDYDGISALIGFVEDSSQEAFAAGAGERLTLDEYEDWWALTQLLASPDNAAKNAYHFLPARTDARWHYVPWDLDSSLGQDWQTHRVEPTTRLELGDVNLLFARMLADPEISARMRDRLAEVLRTRLRIEDVLQLTDTYEAEIGQAAQRDELRWGAEYRSYPGWKDRTDINSHKGEVEYLKQWMRERWRALGDQPP